MTAIFLDTEFNGHNGELISMGFASVGAANWYHELPPPERWEPWCYANVRPMLDNAPIDIKAFRLSLQEYLSSLDNPVIYADWPADFRYLMDLLTGPAYEYSFVVDMQMVLLKNSNPISKRPHHALSDAKALRDWHQGQQESVMPATLSGAAIDTMRQLGTLSMASEGHLRSRICSAHNRLAAALGRTQSSHGDLYDADGNKIKEKSEIPDR